MSGRANGRRTRPGRDAIAAGRNLPATTTCCLAAAAASASLVARRAAAADRALPFRDGTDALQSRWRQAPLWTDPDSIEAPLHSAPGKRLSEDTGAAGRARRLGTRNQCGSRTAASNGSASPAPRSGLGEVCGCLWRLRLDDLPITVVDIRWTWAYAGTTGRSTTTCGTAPIPHPRHLRQSGHAGGGRILSMARSDFPTLTTSATGTGSWSRCLPHGPRSAIVDELWVATSSWRQRHDGCSTNRCSRCRHRSCRRALCGHFSRSEFGLRRDFCVHVQF